MVSDQTVDDLMEAAKGARANAYAPYSRFSVGAAVLAGERIFVGVNVENASYPQGICAERSAVAAAVTAGERTIEAVAVVSSASGDAVTPPCGGCRQVLNEFGPDMLVVSEASDGTRRRWHLSDLLPDAFGPHDLA